MLIGRAISPDLSAMQVPGITHVSSVAQKLLCQHAETYGTPPPAGPERVSTPAQRRDKPMRTHVQQTAQLGELIAAAFDEAARYSTDPREVSRLAARAVAHMLQRAWWALIPLSPHTTRTKARAVA